LARILDKGGIFLALFFGAVLFFYGGAQYLALMLIFFLVAIFVTRYEHETKRDLGLYEHERGWENVLSNGLLPTILALASPYVGFMPFIGSMAAVMADKFGSEIGVLDPDRPVSVFSFQPVKPGVSGAMSRMGTIASLGGAMTIGFAAMFVFGIDPGKAVMVGLSGMIGTVADSVFGVFEEQGVGTKGSTNFICSLVGAIAAYSLEM